MKRCSTALSARPGRGRGWSVTRDQAATGAMRRSGSARRNALLFLRRIRGVAELRPRRGVAIAREIDCRANFAGRWGGPLATSGMDGTLSASTALDELES